MQNIKETQSLSIAKHIEKSQKKITVLFTDIVDSTKHWDAVGDVEARLSVDLHNRLCFSVIKKYRGKILKTIGDSIMASFKRPDDALHAAIGCQQILKRERSENKKFVLHIRIGIHSGRAIIEATDVFGDVVNVAARVESESGSDEILISAKTQKLLRKKYYLKRAGSFIPKGKKKKLGLARCEWQKHDSFIDMIRIGSFLPSNKKQRIELSVYLVCTVLWIYYLNTTVFRFMLTDSKELSLILLDPYQGAKEYPYIVWPVVFVVLIGFFKMLNYGHLSFNIFRFLKGGMYGSIIYILVSLYFYLTPITHSSADLFVSEHLFVEVQLSDVHIRSKKSTVSPPLKVVQKGDLLLLLDVQKKNGIVWNKVPTGAESFGWIPRVIPQRMGVPEKRVSKAEKFHYSLQEFYALLAAIIAWMVGVLRFRIKPV